MAKVKLETFCIQAKLRGGKDSNYFALDDIEGIHFLDIFEQYLGSLVGKLSVSEYHKTILTFEPITKMIDRNQWNAAGRVRLGEFGYGNPIFNVDTFEPKYDKTQRDSELYPLYFTVCGTPGRNRAVLVLQRFGKIGLNTQFKRTFSKFVSEKYPRYLIEIHSLVPKELLKAMVDNGEISQIILRKNKLPKNAIDRLRNKGFTEKVSKMDIVFKGDGGNIFKKEKIKEWISDPDPTFITIEELRDYGLDGTHSVLMKILINGSLREVDFTDTLKIKPYIDVHDDLLFDKDGHPIISSIHEVSLNLGLQLLTNELPKD